MQLGFLEFQARDPLAWDRFLVDVLGLTRAFDGHYRMDRHDWRIRISEGPADDLVAVGWEVDADALDPLHRALVATGHPVASADPAERRAAQRLVVTDPGGVPIELVTGLGRSAAVPSPVNPRGFVADDLGLGHLVLTAPDKNASRAFYDLLGFRLSDHIVTETYGHPVDLSFFHANPRHHSLAFGGPQRKRLHHFMVECRTLDDVGLCHDRTLRAGLKITQTIGRHPNDRMVSFYAQTPSRFQFECGWGGREVDDATWKPTTYDHISEWGHLPPELAYAPKEKRP